MITAYYNEIDPFAAAWLRELIKAGHIAPGEVDTRSIEDVLPSDLAGFSQCHFFAGIGLWSYALRCAGWPDDRPVWTGSCPCQPFSAAGKGGGFADERHLWPAFHHLIRQCRPAIVFGEQVASRDGLAWFDLVQADMEAAGYACGAVDTCAAGFGAPHIRQRLYWVAYADRKQLHRGRFQKAGGEAEFADGGGIIGLADTAFCGSGALHGQSDKSFQPQEQAGGCDFSVGMGNAVSTGLEGHAGHGHGEAGRQDAAGSVTEAGNSGGMENSCGHGRQARWEHNNGDDGGQSDAASEIYKPGPTDGYWRNADWLLCRDGKWRPVEPGTSPLAHGVANRVGRLRGYGNAIVAPQAEAFIKAFMEQCRYSDVEGE